MAKLYFWYVLANGQLTDDIRKVRIGEPRDDDKREKCVAVVEAADFDSAMQRAKERDLI